MPIDFRCANCQKLLRVGDDAAGRQVQCPGCQHVGTVPVGVTGTGGEQNPFGPVDRTEPPPPPNPFQSPTQTNWPPPPDSTQANEYAARRAAGPAVGLIIAASISLALYVGLTAIYSLMLILAISGRQIGNQAAPPGLALGSVFFIVIGVIGILRGILLIVGAVKMKNLDSYGLAMAAAILGVIPCFGCWLIEAPFGIWALVVLNDPAVRAAFRR